MEDEAACNLNLQPPAKHLIFKVWKHFRFTLLIQGKKDLDCNSQLWQQIEESWCKLYCHPKYHFIVRSSEWLYHISFMPCLYTLTFNPVFTSGVQGFCGATMKFLAPQQHWNTKTGVSISTSTAEEEKSPSVVSTQSGGGENKKRSWLKLLVMMRSSSWWAQSPAARRDFFATWIWKRNVPFFPDAFLLLTHHDFAAWLEICGWAQQK